MKKVLFTTACTAAIIVSWCLYTIQPAAPMMTPRIYELLLPEATVRAAAPVDFELVLPEVVIRSGPVNNA